MSKYSFPVPSPRGMQGPISAQGTVGPDAAEDSGNINIRDVLIYAAHCRIAMLDNTNHEFSTYLNPDTYTIDLEIPDAILDKMMYLKVGPKLDRYYSWLTSGMLNLRRETLQFTVG